MNEQAMIKKTMSILGSRKSERKTITARENARQPRPNARKKTMKNQARDFKNEIKQLIKSLQKSEGMKAEFHSSDMNASGEIIATFMMQNGTKKQFMIKTK